MALIPPMYIDCVVAIGTMINGQQKWIETGFLYGELYVPNVSPQGHVGFKK